MKSTTTFIIVAYQPDQEALRVLASLLRPYPVIVIDNGGTKSLGLTGVEVIRNDANVGYGAGANIGLERAFGNGATWAVVVNQDVSVTKNVVEQFAAQLTQTPAGVAGPFIGGLDPKRWTTILGKHVDMRYISGSFFAIHREVVDRIGMFYEPYFLYYEEADYCIRAQKAGFALTHLVISGITHKETTSLGAGSPSHQYYLARNHLLFVERQAPWSVKLYEIARLPKSMIESRAKREKGTLLGIRDYFLRRFGPLKEEK